MNFITKYTFTLKESFIQLDQYEFPRINKQHIKKAVVTSPYSTYIEVAIEIPYYQPLMLNAYVDTRSGYLCVKNIFYHRNGGFKMDHL